MSLHYNKKMLFILWSDTLLVKKIVSETFAEITKPLREAARESDMKESDVPSIIHRFRAKKVQ